MAELVEEYTVATAKVGKSNFGRKILKNCFVVGDKVDDNVGLVDICGAFLFRKSSFYTDNLWSHSSGGNLSFRNITIR